MAPAVPAAVSWSGYSTVIGIGAGTALGSNPLLAAGIGVVVGLSLGLLVDAVVRGVENRRSRSRASVGAVG